MVFNGCSWGTDLAQTGSTQTGKTVPIANNVARTGQQTFSKQGLDIIPPRAVYFRRFHFLGMYLPRVRRENLSLPSVETVVRPHPNFR